MLGGMLLIGRGIGDQVTVVLKRNEKGGGIEIKVGLQSRDTYPESKGTES